MGWLGPSVGLEAVDFVGPKGWDLIESVMGRAASCN